MKIILSISVFMLCFAGLSQTPGEIYQAATPATNYMDPNGDGFTSINSTGYSTGLEDDELTWIGIPQVNTEPDNDLRTGGGCGATDVVDDPATGSDASYVYFDDVNQILIYRIRLAQDASGAFGFSVLVDTDGKFGFTGSNPDPNAVTDNPGNPGFEYEIRFKTGGGNAGLYVEDVDGSTTTNFVVNSYTLGTNTQRAYARFQDPSCSGDPVFYDFYIPLTDLGLTESSTVRLAAATSSSPANSVLKNTSDIAGVDDDAFPSEDDAWIALIALQGEGTPISNLGSGGCFLSGTSDTPVVSPIIFDSNSRINGTSTEPEGAFITVFNNGDTLGSTTTVDANGRWDVTFTQGTLRPFDEITVIARDSCENVSATSTKLNVVNDLDSDNDGVPDSEEGNGIDPGGDADGDDIPNYLDTDYSGFVDTAPADGINDNFDPDGDGIPSHFDLDSNGDGLPDISGSGGSSLDVNNDGVIDTMADSDGDGIPNSADVDFTSGTDANNDGIDDSVQGGVDTDGDGIQDSDDPDIDGDGIANSLDPDNSGTALTISDVDGDGILDFIDLDADGDGIQNIDEGTADFDGDGIPNHQDIDSDNDGILDNIEAQTATGYIAPSGIDTDRDGLDDAYDTDCSPCGTVTGVNIVAVNTDGDSNPDYLDVDSDGDGIGDFTEGNDSNLNGISDVVDVSIVGGLDIDGDGIANDFDPDQTACTDSYNANNGTASSDGICDNVQNGSATDTDGDGLADIYDSDNGGSLPAVQDSDGDGIPNYKDDDDDGDGILTATEGTGFTQGGSPIPDYLYNPDHDGDGISDTSDLDSDNDGILDSEEDGGTGFDPTGDADGDGILNYFDQSDLTVFPAVFPAFSDINNDGINDVYDFDLDGIPDFKDLDTDGDGISDIIEVGEVDSDGDGQVDGNVNGANDINNDGIDDTIGISGTTSIDTDADGNDDYRDIDSDNDGIVDNVEAQNGVSYTSPSGMDSDADGIDDAYDPDNGGTSIIPVNSDSGTGDTDPDYLDTDSDGDGINDIIEGHDANFDGVGDWDSNGNGVVNGAEGTGDADGDGLLDAFDTVTAPATNNATGSNATVVDLDGDGIPNYQDSDDDGDGIDTATEGTGFTQGGSPIPDYLYNSDSDGDGVNDALDLDSDGDGILDSEEDGGTGFDPTGDSDSDGILNYLDDQDGPPTTGMPAFVDTNGDGINDVYDADLDGIADFKDLDSDNDGVLDIIEAGGADTDNDGIVDGNVAGANDANNDGIDDTIGTAGLANPDSDGDGVRDAVDRDSDNDGIPDIIENGGTDANGDGAADATADADRDGILNIYDIDSGNSPITDADTDLDGIPDKRDRDSDGDGIADLIEAGGTDSNNDGVLDDTTDTDGDGFADLIDPDNGGTALSTADTDGDGIPNLRDLDSDGDGIYDYVEAQTTAGYIAPNGSSDANGFDTAYAGAGLIVVDTDGDGNADYADTDSDGDSILDRIEGNDANADGISDSSPSGSDVNGNGMDDTFEGAGELSPQNLDGDPEPDYRDNDDDADGIPTRDEPLDVNPVNGVPNYLENSIDGCGIGFVTTDFNGNVDAVFSNNGVTNFTEVVGPSDGTGAELDDVGDFFILDLTDEIPQGNSVNVRFRTTANNRDINLRITSSLTSGGTYSDTQNFFTSSNVFSTSAYTVNTSGGIRYLRVELTTQEHQNGDGELDAITYSFQQCDADNDLDGVADINDNDDDNDGIPDSTEGLGADATGDADGDGTLNYFDIDYSHPTEGAFVDTNSDGINDIFDTDLDGIINNFDLDSDNDGIPDAIEANDGVLPTHMIDEGRFTIAYVQVNDFDGDGLANVYDVDDGGSALPTSDTDSDGIDDFLDTDADNDGYRDYIEANDDDADGDSLNDFIANAASFESAAGNPGYYTTLDTDLDGIPNWLEDSDGDGIPNFLDPFGGGSAFFYDTDGDGLIDLFDSSTFGSASSINDNDLNGTPDYIQSGALVTLPVELISFNIVLNGNSVELTWVTAQEINNDHFEVEHSTDGLSFDLIGKADGKGTVSIVSDYFFSHRNPTIGFNYYRLKQVDFDGHFEYSEIKRLSVEALENVSFTIYPNPASETATIQVNDGLATKIQLITLNGTILKSITYQEGIGRHTFDVMDVKPGMYLIRVKGPDVNTIKRLVVK